MKQQVSIRIRSDLLDWLDDKAKRTHRTRTNLLEKLIMDAVFEEHDTEPMPDGGDVATDADAARLVLLKEAAAKYGRLHDFLSETIEGGRLTEADCPDDYQAIVDALVDCVPVADRMAALLKDQS